MVLMEHPRGLASNAKELPGVILKRAPVGVTDGIPTGLLLHTRNGPEHSSVEPDRWSTGIAR